MSKTLITLLTAARDRLPPEIQRLIIGRAATGLDVQWTGRKPNSGQAVRPGPYLSLRVISYPAARPDTSRDEIGWACAGLSRLF